MPKNGINDACITSRYKAYNPEGKFVEIVVLNYARKKRYEESGWTFVRTTLRAGDRIVSEHN